MFYLFGLSIACFLILLILLKSGKSLSDYILLLWMILVAAHVTLFYLHHEKIAYQYPQLLGLALPLPVLHGALLYLYCISVTREHFAKPGVVALCLLPFGAMCITVIPFLILPPEQKVYVFEHQGAGFEWFTTFQSIVIPVCGLFFSLLTINEIRKHRRRLLHTFSNHERKMLSWLFVVAICIAIIWILSVPFDDPIIFDAVVLFILLIGLMGIKQAPIFYAHNPVVVPGPPLEVNSLHLQHNHIVSTNHPVASLKSANRERKDDEIISDENSKYAKSGLKVENLPRLKRSLDDYMKHAKPYKDPDLSLDGLATMLHMPSNQLSQIINALEGKTFYHYINMYRISEFLEIATLPENKKFTYLGLANDCGFSSKSTFNKYFKLRTGKTPSEYFAG